MMAGGPRRERTRALLLVGHGSHLNAFSSAPVYDHARRLRATGRFDEVVEAFWKEEPSLRDALALVQSDDVYIVPLFLAEGYFTRQVLPRELGLTDGPPAGGQRVHYCAPIGGHPAMYDLVVDRARSIARDGGFDPSSATLVIIGHGTERSSTSGNTVYDLVRSVAERGDFAGVTCGFLDESPGIAEVLDAAETDNVILVPYFLAEGWHTAATIPRDLSLAGTRTIRGGRTLWYTPPVGILPEIADIVLSIVEVAAGGPMDFDPASRSPVTSITRPITVARRRFFEWVDGAGQEGVVLLRSRIRRSADGSYSVAHEADRDTPTHLLAGSDDPEHALEIARIDDQGRYRPLRHADSLRRGWSLESLGAEGLWRAVSLLYPGAVLRWAEVGVEAGGRAATHFDAWAARQSGMYERVGSIAPGDLAATISDCCGDCLRVPRWNPAARMPGTIAAPVPGGTDPGTIATVPCLEPCSVFGSRAHRRLSDRAKPPVADEAPQPA
jgi:sirohydrochlorin cobaltochelatase